MSRGGRPRERATRRMCLGCRAVQEKAALVRLVAGPSGVEVDGRQARPGRGAYVCRSEVCVTRAARQLAKALRSPGLEALPGGLWTAVRAGRAPEPEAQSHG
jgi:predicted RNA-binding protein YlxR (DUF448 family)